MLLLYAFQVGGCGEVGVGLFPRITKDRTRENGLKLHRGGLDCIYGKKLST